MRVLGVDPGLNTTGYAVLESHGSRVRICEAGVIRSRAQGRLESRLAEIHAGVTEVLAAFRPQVMAVEELFSHYARPQTAILMGHARGVICLAAAAAGIPLCSYAATQIKKMLTGSGRATKQQMQLAVCREFSLPAPPDPPDVADAMAIALCHFYLCRKEVSLS
jgi:crossover junction endodeoxyribonuclease RuvC